MSPIDNTMFALSNLRVAQNLPEIFAVTSGKGGVGKTHISVNVALLLRQLKKNVLLVDADIHLGNVDLLFGIRPKHTVADVIAGQLDLRRVIMRGPQGLDILPASSAVMDLLDMEDTAIKKLNDAFGRFEHDYDTVVVDTGAGITRNVTSFVLGADKVVIVVTPDPAAIADAYGTIKVIKHSNDAVPILLVVNMVTSEDEGESLYKKMNLMVQRFLNGTIAFGGTLLRDSLIADSILRQRPVVIEHPHSRPVNDLKLITRNLLRLPTTDVSKRRGFFDRFMSYRNVLIGEQ